MVSTLSFSALNSPGVYVEESQLGFQPVNIAGHSACYMFGYAPNAPVGTVVGVPTQVVSQADFRNQFGTGSGSDTSVGLYFAQDQNGMLYFVPVSIAPQFTVSVDEAAAGAYTLSVNGSTVTYTALADDTITDIRDALVTAINQTNALAGTLQSYSVAGVTDELYIRLFDSEGDLAVTAVTDNLTALDTTPVTPGYIDYVAVIDNVFDEDDNYDLGFLIAPEAFSGIDSQFERLSVANALNGQAANSNMVALVDSSDPLLTIGQINTEHQQYTTAIGHLAYYAPWVLNLEGTAVPPSAAVAGVASKKYRAKGFQEPPGGTTYSLKGVNDVSVRFNKQQQGQVNPTGGNLLRNLFNYGVVVWGMRTRSANTLYQFVHTRVIMNVLNATMQNAFWQFPINSIGSQGQLLHYIEETAIAACRELYFGGAFFGQTEQQAFKVVCNFTNNSNAQLEAGNILLEVYAVTVPGAEKILVGTYRVAAGSLPNLVA